MNTQLKTQISKDSLSIMEELFHEANYQVSGLEAISGASVYGWDVELEVYPPGESYPHYFTIHYYLFSELLEEWYTAQDIAHWLDITKDDEGDPITPMWWYQNIARDKDQVEVTNYVINRLFNQIF